MRRTVLTICLALGAALSWGHGLDQAAQENTGATLSRALAAFAVARGLNGVISVAQGTELAIQPVGVGVTLTLGEVLDPLNDLVEQFSWLALLACVSLGTQMLLAEVAANVWINGALSAAAAAGVLALWIPAAAPVRVPLLRLATVLLFARFLFALVTLTTGLVDQLVLAERQQEALDRIEFTRERIEELQQQAGEATPPEDPSAPTVLQRFGAFLDDQRQALNVKAQLDALTERAENAIEELVNLIVVFVVQTILVPVAALLLAYWGLRALWRAPWRPPDSR